MRGEGARTDGLMNENYVPSGISNHGGMVHLHGIPVVRSTIEDCAMTGFYPYHVEYWTELGLEPDVSETIGIDAHDEDDARKRFLALKIKHMYYIIHEPMLED